MACLMMKLNYVLTINQSLEEKDICNQLENDKILTLILHFWPSTSI